MRGAADDAGTLAYLADCAGQAGLATAMLDMSEIGLCRRRASSIPPGREIRRLFKLYPWEWMFADDFGRAPAVARTRFVEPPWKLILSCKGALALLWEMAPHHPNLLECYFEGDREAEFLKRYARKPLYSREGADIELKGDGEVLRGVSDNYGAEGTCARRCGRCRSSTAATPSSAPGSSATRRPGWGFARTRRR